MSPLPEAQILGTDAPVDLVDKVQGNVEKAGPPGQWPSLGEGGSRGESCRAEKPSAREGA